MRLRSLGIGIVCAGILSVFAFAEDSGAGRTRGSHRRGEAGERSHAYPTPDQQVERLNKDLNLSQEQQDKIRKVLTDHREQMRQQMQARTAEHDKVKDLDKQLEEANKAGDKEKAKALEGQIQELRTKNEKQMAASRQKLMTDVEAVLTPEQKTKFQQIKDEVFPGRPSLEGHPEMLLKAVESLKLAKDKEQKIKGIVDEWKTKAQASKDRTAAKAGAAEVYKKVMAELTPEEQAKVKAWHPSPGDWQHERGQGKGEGRGHKAGAKDAKAPGAAEANK